MKKLLFVLDIVTTIIILLAYVYGGILNIKTAPAGAVVLIILLIYLCARLAWLSFRERVR